VRNDVSSVQLMSGIAMTTPLCFRHWSKRQSLESKNAFEFSRKVSVTFAQFLKNLILSVDCNKTPQYTAT
jgi:hypothetical protein